MKTILIMLMVFVILFLLIGAIKKIRELRQIDRKVSAMSDPNLLLLYHKLQDASESVIYKRAFVDTVIYETISRKLINP